MGPHLDPILGNLVEIDQACCRQAGHVLHQQLLDAPPLRRAKVGQGMMVDPDPATEPAIGRVVGAKPRDGAGAANPIARRVKPQGQKQLRRRLRHARATLARPHLGLEIGKIQPLHISPNQPRRVILADQPVKIDHLKPHLVAHRHTKPRLARHYRLATATPLLRKIIKQTAHPQSLNRTAPN